MVPKVGSQKYLKYFSNTAKLLTHADFINKLNKVTALEIKKLFKNKNASKRDSKKIINKPELPAV